MPFSTYQRERIGSAIISPNHPLEAGSHEEITIIYVAGPFGLDDTGGLKLCWRGASDSSAPQFSDPIAANYTTAEASNGAILSLSFAKSSNIRPWSTALRVQVVRGYLSAGDTITIRLGDRRGGSPGYRLQTAVETPFYFRTFVDAFATYEFVELPASPTLSLVAGPAVRFKAILPTKRRVGEAFQLAIVPEDRWGNVTDHVAQSLILKPTIPVDGLPASVTLASGAAPIHVQGVSSSEPGDLWIDLHDAEGNHLGRSNPLRLVSKAEELPYWGDLHGQSGESIGTGTAEEYFHFARDKAFLDITGHQANDFQVSDDFWAEINRLAVAFDSPGSFVAFPGYEWSGNTAVGGDRNVFYASEGRTIRRSSSVLQERPASSDVHHVRDLFTALEGEDAVVIAHVGGRYANLAEGHDGRLERAVEIHSSWGTFEWLLFDAFALGHRVGIVCHSDDHKGRPGAAYPGASQFGAVGGLTCYSLKTLDRSEVFRALRNRAMYGTTGARLLLEVEAHLPQGSSVLSDDPQLGPVEEHPATLAHIGQIVRTPGSEITLDVEVLGSAPIERLTYFNGAEIVATQRAYSPSQLGRRIRVLFEGAEYRGRGRETFWRGFARLNTNRFSRAKAINHFNTDKPLRLAANGERVEFDTVTTGNFSGFDLWLNSPDSGTLDLTHSYGTESIVIADIGYEDIVIDFGGLGRRIRIFRLPDDNAAFQFSHQQRMTLHAGRDNPLFVRITQEDGHQAWTSPIYILPS